ncbi:hypothetical protein V2A60_005908 [Cordyceps javanica]
MAISGLPPSPQGHLQNLVVHHHVPVGLGLVARAAPNGRVWPATAGSSESWWWSSSAHRNSTPNLAISSSADCVSRATIRFPREMAVTSSTSSYSPVGIATRNMASSRTSRPRLSRCSLRNCFRGNMRPDRLDECQ